LIFRLKEPEKMQRELKVVFQSLIGFLNIAGAQQGQPPLDVNTEMLGDHLIVSTAYLPDSDQG
jgi:hypothetical protein